MRPGGEPVIIGPAFMSKSKNTVIVIGVDEVGRGCIFGPMVVCAAANPTGWYDAKLRVRDSKQVKREKERQEIAAVLKDRMVWHTVEISVEGIDRFGTERTLLAAGRRAAFALRDRLKVKFPHARFQIVFDGDDHEAERGEDYEIVSIPKADATVFEVSAASIIAKVKRDDTVHWIAHRNMETLREYRLDESKGYATPAHIRAVMRLGRTKWHRRVATDTLIRNQKAKAHGTPTAPEEGVTAPPHHHAPDLPGQAAPATAAAPETRSGHAAHPAA